MSTNHGVEMSPDKEEIPTERSKLLREAESIVNRDRNSVYGNPEDNFQDIADLWSAYKGVRFTMMDVAVMNMLIKVARLKKTPTYRDGLVDIAGYAACGADIQKAMLGPKHDPAHPPELKPNETMVEYLVRQRQK
jgi:hypothetical protein